MDYITTNIRFEEDQYNRLKAEAARRRKSLSAIVREKVKTKEKARTKKEINQLLAETDKLAEELGRKLKGFDSVKAIREMRYEGKW